MEFCCPKCHSDLKPSKALDDHLICQHDGCGQLYPIVDQCPILLNEDNSVFQFRDFTHGDGVTTMDVRSLQPSGGFAKFISRVKNLTPQKTASVNEYGPNQLIHDLMKNEAGLSILVVGAGEAHFSTDADIDITYSDVTLGPLTDVIADAHDLPFQDGKFDLVILVAVLEHVVAPFRLAEEVTRVLKPGGHVYANTPFMQQVHMGAYDFSRFTHLGHRLLWKHFSEVRSGVANGPGTAVSWSLEYFVRSLFSTSSKLETLACYIVRIITWPFRVADRFIHKKPGSFDAASAYYFVGKKCENKFSPRELLETYKGKQR